jgi:DNA topoisomerase-1
MLPESLIYMDDSVPGFTRRRRGQGWSYHAPDGTHVADRSVVERLNGIALPPAYTDCWFSPRENGHLQGTGYDGKRRKQYRYHPDYRAAREQRKFERLPLFGEALPEIRKRVASDLRQRNRGKERALAAIVRLLDDALMRVGNASYAERNGSYGATTLENDHADLRSRRLTLKYRAKSGRERRVDVDDSGLLRFVRDMQDLPGQRLFQYLDAAGEPHEIDSQDVNDYIRARMGEQFSAKDFRTFGASALAYAHLLGADDKITISALTENVSERLGNTPVIARKSYIHPALVELCGVGPEELRARLPRKRKTRWMTGEERAMIAWLEQH